jgi:hypothetical protein
MTGADIGRSPGLPLRSAAIGGLAFTVLYLPEAQQRIRKRLILQWVGAPPVRERPRRLLVGVGDQPPAQAKQEHEPVWIPTDIRY